MRNFNKVQWETLRKKVDVFINDTADELSDCYYNYWRQENSKPFFSWDMQSTIADSKAQFDLLHGLIYHLHTILLFKVNQQDNDYDEQKMFATYNRDTGELLNPIGKVVEARQWIAANNQVSGINISAIRTSIINNVQTNLSKTVDLD